MIAFGIVPENRQSLCYMVRITYERRDSYSPITYFIGIVPEKLCHILCNTYQTIYAAAW